MSDTKLEPCPCCGANNDPNATGSDAILLVPEKHNRWFVCCNPCGMRTAFQGSQSAAIAAWNQRAGWRTDAPPHKPDLQIVMAEKIGRKWLYGVVEWKDGKWLNDEGLGSSENPKLWLHITPPTEAGGKS